ncbi:nuclease-related domain-containing protein [Burkholderia stabilis]
MQNIELYFGSTEKQDVSEQSALRRILHWLVEHQQPAIVICDVWLHHRQIDILVGTHTTTLQIEIKGYRAPVAGQQNGEWTLTYADGSIAQVKNGYLQALRNNQTLRDEMSKHLDSGETVSYPKGAVMFEPGIPHGSTLLIPADPRVTVCGADELDHLLSAPGRNPWPLAWLRDFALARNLIARSIPDAMTSQTVAHAYEVAERTAPVPIAAAPLPSRHAVVNRVPEAVVKSQPFTVAPRPVVERARVANDTGQHKPIPMEQSRGHVPLGLSSTIERRPTRRRAILRSASVVLAVAGIAYASVHWHRTTPSAPKQAHASEAGKQESRPTSNVSRGVRHTPTRQVAREPRMSTAGVPPVDSHVPKQERSENVRAPIAVVSSADTSTITCPAGVDRLGCNGKTGVLTAPECPPAFHVLGNTCVRDQGN